MSEVLQKYLPEHAVHHCFELIKANHVHLKIVNERQTRHGDYRKNIASAYVVKKAQNKTKRYGENISYKLIHLREFLSDGLRYFFSFLGGTGSTPPGKNMLQRIRRKIASKVPLNAPCISIA